MSSIVLPVVSGESKPTTNAPQRWKAGTLEAATRWASASAATRSRAAASVVSSLITISQPGYRGRIVSSSQAFARLQRLHPVRVKTSIVMHFPIAASVAAFPQRARRQV